MVQSRRNNSHTPVTIYTMPNDRKSSRFPSQYVSSRSSLCAKKNLPLPRASVSKPYSCHHWDMLRQFRRYGSSCRRHRRIMRHCTHEFESHATALHPGRVVELPDYAPSPVSLCQPPSFDAPSLGSPSFAITERQAIFSPRVSQTHIWLQSLVKIPLSLSAARKTHPNGPPKPRVQQITRPETLPLQAHAAVNRRVSHGMRLQDLTAPHRRRCLRDGAVECQRMGHRYCHRKFDSLILAYPSAA